MATVVLLGTMDTKEAEYAFARKRLIDSGVDVIVVDVGVVSDPVGLPDGVVPDIGADQVARAGGSSIAALREAADRGAAMATMADGATQVLADLLAQGRLDGALALGGSGGTSIAAHAFRALPLGVPKMIMSTVAVGETTPYIMDSDLILVPSLVDVAGVNRISARVIANTAAAMVGMVGAAPVDVTSARPMIAASMFGVTTPCVTAARKELERLGYEVLVFHMTGAGGRMMESLIAQGFFEGVLDVTTTELVDEIVGATLSAGPDRLTAAGRLGVPQLVSVGATDMANFGPRDSVPASFEGRTFVIHNEAVTLMRTTPEECAEIGADIARKVSASTGPVTVLLPLGGVSAIAGPGGPFFDPHADAVLFNTITDGLAEAVAQGRVGLLNVDANINDPEFALLAARTLDDMIQGREPLPLNHNHTQGTRTS